MLMDPLIALKVFWPQVLLGGATDDLALQLLVGCFVKRLTRGLRHGPMLITCACHADRKLNCVALHLSGDRLCNGAVLIEGRLGAMLIGAGSTLCCRMVSLGCGADS